MRATSFISVAASLLATASAQDTLPISSTLQKFLQSTNGSNLYTYPTDFTRGIVPKPFHSHNDYWRDLPFYSALSVGAVSVEADVWLVNGTLYIGHEQQALTTARTFASLYINPILDVLHRQNPITPFSPTQTHNGVYDTASGQTLYLFIDIKTDGIAAWPYVLNALQPLYKGGWLTTYNGTGLTAGAVTVIGTGNTPLSLVQAPAAGPVSSTNPRYAFYDAPLPNLNGTFSNITRFDSPIASTDFAAQFGTLQGQSMNATQLALLRSQLASAHAKGIAARYWDQPGYPVGTRNAVWRILIDEGADLLNVDDLEGAANYWQGDSFDTLGVTPGQQ